jgi:uncharacterized protein (TIRG00374 family)
MNWRRISRIGSPVLLAGMFAVILIFTDIHKVGHAFSGIKWKWAVWVPVLNLANTFVEALRLAVILFPINKRFQLRHALNSMLLMIIGNVLLPLRFGDGARACYLAKAVKIDLSSSLSALMLDRIADFLFFFVLIALTAMLHQLPASLEKAAIFAAVLFAGGIALVAVLAGLGRRMGDGSGGRIRRRIGLEARSFLTGLSVMKNAGLILPIGILSGLSWILRGAMIWVMFQAFSLDLPFIATPITLIVLNLGIAAVSTPANMGGFELAVVGALKLFSVGIEAALIYALALHVVEVVPIVIVGAVVLWLEGVSTDEVMRTAREAPLCETGPGS